MFSSENRSATGLAIWWFVLAFVLVIGVSFGYMYLLRPMLNLQTAANRASFQYVDTTQTTMMTLISQYDDLDSQIASGGSNAQLAAWTAQEKAIVTNLKVLKAKLMPAQVPPDVSTFLMQHPVGGEGQ